MNDTRRAVKHPRNQSSTAKTKRWSAGRCWTAMRVSPHWHNYPKADINGGDSHCDSHSHTLSRHTDTDTVGCCPGSDVAVQIVVVVVVAAVVVVAVFSRILRGHSYAEEVAPVALGSRRRDVGRRGTAAVAVVDANIAIPCCPCAAVGLTAVARVRVHSHGSDSDSD